MMKKMVNTIRAVAFGLAVLSSPAWADLAYSGKISEIPAGQSTIPYWEEATETGQIVLWWKICQPTVPELMKGFGATEVEAFNGCLTTANSINHGRPGWVNPNVVKVGQTMLVPSAKNFTPDGLKIWRDRMVARTAVTKLAKNPMAMATAILELRQQFAAGKLSADGLNQRVTDLLGKKLSDLKGDPTFLALVEGLVNSQLETLAPSATPLDLSGLQQQVADNTAAINATKADVTTLKGEVATLRTTKADASALEALSGRVDTLESVKVGLGATYGWMFALGVAIVVLFGSVFLWWRKASKTALTTVKATAKSALVMGDGLMTKLVETNDRVTVVERQVSGRKSINIPAGLEKSLECLLTDLSTFTATITVDGVDFRVTFTVDQAVKGQPMVTLSGVKDQTRAVRIDNVRSVLLRAAAAGRLTESVQVASPVAVAA